MKKKSLLFSVLCMMCVALLTGCGEDTYEIRTNSSNYEAGTISGGGNYEMGATVNLTITSNLGCRVNSSYPLTFRDANGGTSTLNLTQLTSTTYSYQFAVTQQTIGEYTANFECNTNDAESLQNTEVKKHTVKFIYDIEGTTEDFEKDVIVADGNRVERIDYIDGVKGKLNWYTIDPNSTTFLETSIYTFENLVSSNLTLYGKIVEQTPLEAVKEAIENFKSTSRFEIINENNVEGLSEGNYKAEILDLEAGVAGMRFTLYKGTFNESVPGLYTYTQDSVIQDGKYYINGSNDRKSVYNIASSEADSGYTFQEMYRHYGFVEIADINIEDYHDSITVEANKSTETIDGKEVSLDVYTLSGQTFDYILSISNGIIYGVFKAYSTTSWQAYIINYPTGVLPGSTLSNAKEGYLINLYSNNDNLSDILNDRFSGYLNVLRVVPSFAQTVEGVIRGNETIKNLTKSYNFTLTEYSAGQCSNIPYDNTSLISNDVSVCLRVLSTEENLASAIGDLSTGNFNITLDSDAFTVLGDSYTKPSYDVASGTNVLSLTSNPENSIPSKIYETIVELRKVVDKDYDRFVKDGDNTYLIYKGEGDSVPCLKISVGTEEAPIVRSVEYFDGKNTYISTFTFN